MSTKISNIRLAFFCKTRCFLVLVLFILLLVQSCKKLVEIPPPSQALAENNVYATDISAIGVMNGIYASLTNDGVGFIFQGLGSIGLFAGLSADELSLFGNNNPYISYYKNGLSGTLPTMVGHEHWAPLYKNIFRCNAVVEGVSKSTTLTPVVKEQLIGEAKFMRAFFYFYLVNLFGDVPLALSTDPSINTLLNRTPKNEVYQLIISDLKESKQKLSTNYLDASLLRITSERVRPTKWAAQALLARVYLYTEAFALAEEESTEIINNNTLYGPLPILNNVFLKNSREAIWQLQPTTNDLNTSDGKIYIIPPTGPSSINNPAFLSKFLLSSFEAGDQRAIFGNWIDTTIYKTSPTSYDTVPYVFKYKIYSSLGVTSIGALTEYIMVLRVGEQYLVRAEARAQLSNISGSQSDLNVIRTRSGLPNTSANDKQSLLAAILEERRHELFTEWGHRWLDLKRTGKIDGVMSVITPLKSNGTIPWKSYQQLYPISQSELNKAPNLTQTPGY